MFESNVVFQFGNLSTSYLINVSETKEKRSGSKANKIVEIGIFVDDRAYRTYSDYFNQGSTKATKKKIVFLILALMNGVQAVYHYPNLRESVDFRIVYLEIQENSAKFKNIQENSAFYWTHHCSNRTCLSEF